MSLQLWHRLLAFILKIKEHSHYAFFFPTSKQTKVSIEKTNPLILFKRISISSLLPTKILVKINGNKRNATQCIFLNFVHIIQSQSFCESQQFDTPPNVQKKRIFKMDNFAYLFIQYFVNRKWKEERQYHSLILLVSFTMSKSMFLQHFMGRSQPH